MKFIVTSIILGLVLNLALVNSAFATTTVDISDNGENSKSNVSVKSNVAGSSTTCINGKCTTTEGESNSTVCVNGECYTSEDGNIDVKSTDGNTTVTINNSKVSTDSSKPTVTPKEKIKKFFNKKVTKEELKEKFKERKQNWAEFIKEHTVGLIMRLLSPLF